ncbi:MAG: DUF1361 domain-containing protein [Erysipelotrichales bacterium]
MIIIFKNKLNWYIRITFVVYLLTIFFFHNLSNRYIYFMILNVSLAYIPFELSNAVKFTKNKFLIIFFSCFWLVFYPNAPYLLTDFFHLEALNIYSTQATFNPYLSDWAAFSVITLGILFGYIIGIISMYNVYNQFKKEIAPRSGLIFSSLFVVITSLLSGFAIYLGRFPRLHTHYLLENPMKIINIILENINMQSFAFSILMALWQIPIIVTFILFKRQFEKK